MSRPLLGLLVFAAASLAAPLAASLGGCGALDPYPTVPRPPLLGAAAGTRVAICYNTLTTTLAEVEAQAQQECAANTLAEPVDTDWYMQNCPLLLPARATFLCSAKK